MEAFGKSKISGALTGKIAVVTGSSGGIGKGIALELAKQGASVVITGTKITHIEETVTMIKNAGGDAVGRAFDVGKKEEIDQFFEKDLKELGGVDIFVNNAGVIQVGYFLDNTEEDLEWMARVDFMGAAYCIQNAAKVMKERGGGNIIVITSLNAFSPLPSQSFYSAIKAGLEGLVKGIAYELCPYGIRVNTVAPGATYSEMLNQLTPEQIEDVRQAVPLKRIGEPKDIAKAVAYLAGPDASYVTGTSILVDGGLMLRQG